MDPHVCNHMRHRGCGFNGGARIALRPRYGAEASPIYWPVIRGS